MQFHWTILLYYGKILTFDGKRSAKKVEKLYLANPMAVQEALAKGRKLVVFEVDEKGNPILPVSEINVKKMDDLPKNRDIIQPALEYVDERYDRPVRLDTLADLCDVSKSYLCRVFKETVGMGVSEYVTERRMREAQKLLRDTDMTVVIIAMEVGYVDCGYFNKLFKKRYGVTPLEYRRLPRIDED